MASESHRRWLFTFAGNVTPKKDESLADSLLTSYIDTQFFFIESSLNNLRKQLSTSAWKYDDCEGLDTLRNMFHSVRRLINKDKALALKNAKRVERMQCLIANVIEVEIDPRRKKQIPPKVEEPPQRDPSPSRLSDSQDTRYRRPLNPGSAVHSEKEMAIVAQLKAELAKRNAAVASGAPTEACFQTLNPYVV